MNIRSDVRTLQAEGSDIVAAVASDYLISRVRGSLCWKIDLGMGCRSYFLSWCEMPPGWVILPDDSSAQRERLVCAVRRVCERRGSGRADFRPWVIYRMFSTSRVAVARFANRCDADDYLRVLQRLMSRDLSAHFAIAFEEESA